ncbi:MAG: hypothetical protein BroJett040_20210 [Oligoflexia bacterium]|nr:MAG: hypothetical protein BroJett040_20210 [Oligoflexia bacterium]
MVKLGIDQILTDSTLLKELNGRKISLVAHPAAVTSQLVHSLDALKAQTKLNIVSAFGPQHGMRGEKQDNMIESEDYLDPKYKIPVYSLYGKTRRPTKEMLQSCDVVLFDLQDVGTRIYTFLTTLRYMCEACVELGKSFWILDRPNPVGRPIEGLTLLKGHESFVGAAEIPMRHGLTLGEAALFFKKYLNLNLDLKIVKMENYFPEKGSGFGWPTELSWVNPSPNAQTLNMARCFPGTVMIEGTTLSEMRGTTRALEGVGASDIDAERILSRMNQLAPDWLRGSIIRTIFFEPTFHKHKGLLCQGIQMHTDHPSYNHELFRPYRVISLFLKVVRELYPDYVIWRDFAYEYELERKAIDVIHGTTQFREWVDDPKAKPGDLENLLSRDEKAWKEQRREFLIY